MTSVAPEDVTRTNRFVPATPNESVRRVARRAVSGRLEMVRLLLPCAARRHADPEDVHQLRVWARRSVAAIDMFRPVLAPKQAKRLRRRLQSIRRAAAMARDLDVLDLRLSLHTGDPSAQTVLGLVRQRRQRARRALKRTLARNDKGKRLARERARIRKDLKRATRHQEDVPFGGWAVERILPLAAELVDSVPHPDDPDDGAALHEYRLLVKRVRYALEPLAGAFSPGLRERVYAELKSLQDRLGAINDHVVAADLFRVWAVHTHDPAEIAALRRLADLEDAERRVTTEVFRSWWTDERQERLRRDLEAEVGRPLAADRVRREPAPDRHRAARLRDPSPRPDRVTQPTARSVRAIR